ncbi:MAG: SPOR domain-containing protein [Magnetococcales bacterium]|nr:SPOR domain-containing protein [Magnetococcales bacterium]
MNMCRAKVGNVAFAAVFFMVLLVLPRPAPAESPAESPPVPRHRFTLVTDPHDASVRIHERAEPYTAPIVLPEGRYHVSVTAPGYVSEHGTVEIKGTDWSGLVRLVPAKTGDPSTRDKNTLDAEWDKLRREQERLTAEKEVLEGRGRQLAKDEARLADALKKSEKENRERPAQGTVASPVPDGSASASGTPDIKEEIRLAMNHLQEAQSRRKGNESAMKERIDRLLAVAPNDPEVQRVKQLYGERYMIYVGTFASEQKAGELETRLRALTLPSFRQEFQIQGRKMMRVCVGLFSGRQEAMNALSLLQRDFNVPDAIVRKFRN